MSAPTIEQRFARLHSIGIALSSERNLNKLLELIVDEARAFTTADGGSLYLVDGKELHFAIVQTTSLNIRMGGAQGAPITWPAVPLEVNGHPNVDNVCAYVAITGHVVNIPDVYNAPGFDFDGTKKFDGMTGYRSRSMLVVPLRDHESHIIGVLQLINAGWPGNATGFASEDEALVSSLASQAAVAITNVRLIKETEELFEAFVRVMAAAIDELSPATSGHVRRVAEIMLALAAAVNRTADGPYADFHLDEDALNELRIAAWMHDVGKVTTPLHIVEKRTKLESVRDGIEIVRARFACLEERLRAQYAERKLAIWKGEGVGEEKAAREALLEQELQAELTAVEDDLRFIEECNIPVEYMPTEKAERIRRIAERTYVEGGREAKLLTADEAERLCVQRGNLTKHELDIMREHASVTNRLLSQIPFTRKLRRVPAFAGAHHEKLNGKGYPQGLAADRIPPQVRMMTIADVYDALTAADRSYKKACTPQEALRILGFMAKDGEIDPDLLAIFQSMIAGEQPA